MSCGNSSDVQVTAYSRCETSCHPVTAVTVGGAETDGQLFHIFFVSYSAGVIFDGYFLFCRLKKRKQYVRYRPRKTRFERRCLQTWKHSANIIRHVYRRFLIAKTRACASEKTETKKREKRADRKNSGLKRWRRYRRSPRSRQPATADCTGNCGKTAEI